MSDSPVAYEWQGLTFCPSCALKSTGIGMVIGRLPWPKDMDEAIASIALAQVERGLPIETPVALTETAAERCESCGHALSKEEIA